MHASYDLAILIRSLEVGGAERQASLLASALSQAGIRVAIVTFYAGGALSKELIAQGIPVKFAGKRSRWDLIGFSWRLVRIFWELRPRVIYTFMPSANLAGVVIRHVARSHRLAWGIRASDMRLSHTSMFLRAVDWLEVRVARFADVIISNSKAGRAAHLAAGFPPDSFLVIPNAIDAERFQYNHQSRLALREKLGIPSDCPLIGTVARLDPMKDHACFLRAAAALDRMGFTGQFLCVGSGEPNYVARLKDLANQLQISQKLHLLEGVEDPTQAYSAIDVFVSSSAYGEGFSNAIGEAMACGLPCVATDVGDAAEIVTEEDSIVPVGNSEALAHAIQKQLLRPRARATTAGRTKVLTEFNIARLVARTLAALEIDPPRGDSV